MAKMRGDDSLEKIWSTLELESDTNFFISWNWIESWLRVMKPCVSVCKVYSGKRIVALGLFVISNATRHRILRITQLRLQTVGDDKKDQIWPEYNNMLVARGFESAVYQGLIGFMDKQAKSAWDEFVLGPIDESLLKWVSADNYYSYNIWEEPTYGIDFLDIRAKNQCYLDSLSKNTRYQIRRAIRDYGEGLAMVVAGSKEEALQFFQGISTFHKQRWRDASGFHNPFFVEFHRDLIAEGFDNGVIELVRLQVGNVDIGYLYNFIYNNKVYFYLSGIDLVTENKRKPGLVLHALCIQRHLELGADSYDFLGGQARYKESLGSQNGMLVVTAYQKPLFKLRVEQVARRLKHYVQTKVLSN